MGIPTQTFTTGMLEEIQGIWHPQRFLGRPNPQKSKLVGGFFPPIRKIWSSNWIISPNKGEHKKPLKPPTR